MNSTSLQFPAPSPLTGTSPSGAVSVLETAPARRGRVPHAGGAGGGGEPGHGSVFHAVGDARAGGPTPGLGVDVRASAAPGMGVPARLSSAEVVRPCREARGGGPAIAGREGASQGAPQEAAQMRLPNGSESTAAPPARNCPSTDACLAHAVQPFVPAVMNGGTAEPASSQPGDMGARGGQARPLLLPASRNLFAPRPRAPSERTVRDLLECLL